MILVDIIVMFIKIYNKTANVNLNNLKLSKIWKFLQLYSKLTTTYEKVSNLSCCVQTPADRSAVLLQNFNLWQVCDVLMFSMMWGATLVHW